MFRHAISIHQSIVGKDSAFVEGAVQTKVEVNKFKGPSLRGIYRGDPYGCPERAWMYIVSCFSCEGCICDICGVYMQ
jgi:hypothetical protein